MMKVFFILVWQVFVTSPAPCPGYGNNYDEFGNKLNSGRSCLVSHMKVEKVAESFRVFESTEALNAFKDGMGGRDRGDIFNRESRHTSFESYKSTTTFGSVAEINSADWKVKYEQ